MADDDSGLDTSSTTLNPFAPKKDVKQGQKKAIDVYQEWLQRQKSLGLMPAIPPANPANPNQGPGFSQHPIGSPQTPDAGGSSFQKNITPNLANVAPNLIPNPWAGLNTGAAGAAAGAAGAGGAPAGVGSIMGGGGGGGPGMPTTSPGPQTPDMNSAILQELMRTSM